MIKVKKIQGVIEAIADSIKSYNKVAFNSTLPNLIVDSASIPIYDWDEILKGALYTEPSRFVICVIHECVTLLLQIDKNKLPKNKRYLFITNGRWNKSDFDIPLDYDFVPWTKFMFDNFTHSYTHPATNEFWYDKSYDFSYPKKGSFICLIGNERPNRTTLVEKIMSDDSFGNFMLRYNNKILRYPGSDLDIYYKNNDLDFNFPKNSKIMNGFCYNLVVETNSYDVEEFNPTEKTITPLGNGMPFVIASSYRFLHNLRDIGFKTYDCLWSEDYDEIKDWDKRSDSLLQTCKQIANFDWQANRSQLIEIAWHNSNVMRNLQKIVERDIKDFVKKVQEGLEASGYRY